MKNKLIRMAVKMAYKQHITTYYKKRAKDLSTKNFNGILTGFIGY